MAAAQHYVEQLQHAIRAEDGMRLSALLKVPERQFDTAQLLSAFSNEKRWRAMCQAFGENLSEVIECHCRCLYLCSVHRYKAAFEEQLKALTAFRNEMQVERPPAQKTNWWLRPINVVMTQFRLVAYKADEKPTKGGEGRQEATKKVPDELQKFFRYMIIDKSPLNVSKKMGALFAVVHMLKAYFKLNNLRLCNNIIKAVQAQTFPALHNFPRSQQVAYNYYLGRRKMFEENYAEADKALGFAFAHCHRDATANKRRVLEFLVPVRVYLGCFPDPKLLKKYDLEAFLPLIVAVRNGSLAEFEAQLRAQQEYFIRQGIYLILEKLRTFVYRNLFQKVLRVNQQRQSNTKKSLLPFEVLMLALKLNESDMDIDELECVVANLIYDGYIRGYIAHRRGVMFSPTVPFPPFKDVISA